MKPKDLLLLSSVPHRKHENQKGEVSRGFQRIIKKNKITSLQDFIKSQTKNGPAFPTNLVVAINDLEKITTSLMSLDLEKTGNKKEKKSKKNSNPDSFMRLKLEPSFGLINIIDGQHRLFAYDGLDEKADNHLFLVTAYKNLKLPKQMELFVEINDGATKVDKSLLWDLYPEIYIEADPKFGTKVKVSKLVKEYFNEDKKSALFHSIKYPSAPYGSKGANISLSSFCQSFIKQKVFSNSSHHAGLLLSNSQMDEHNIQIVANLYNLYFDVLKNLAGETHWKDKKTNAYNHNITMQAFLILFTSVISYVYEIKKVQKFDVKKLKEEFSKILKPLAEYLENEYQLKRVKNLWSDKLGGGGPNKVWQIFISKIYEKYNDFEKEANENRETYTLIDENLEKIQNEGEGESLEAKATFETNYELFTRTGEVKKIVKKPEKKYSYQEKIVQTLSAFANTNGGFLLIGVEDDEFMPVGLNETDLKLGSFVDSSSNPRYEKYKRHIKNLIISNINDGDSFYRNYIKKIYLCSYEKVCILVGINVECAENDDIIEFKDNTTWIRTDDNTEKVGFNALKRNIELRKKRQEQKKKKAKCSRCGIEAEYDQIHKLIGWRTVNGKKIPQSDVKCRSL